ncbi:MAG TPA: DEAD/DEAH box helicase family protein [Rhodanobacteraceae bacterium]|nr:DEAD/DEAH box helicase family protein [Rhodanobacteraceae bacterium]
MSETASELAQRLGGRRRDATWPVELTPVVEWAVERTRQNGRLDKAELIAHFPAVECHYSLLRDAIPQCFRDLKGGPRGRGGWRLKASRTAAPIARDPIPSEIMEIALDDQLDAEQAKVANRLCELLSHDELREHVGHGALNSLRSLVRALHGCEPSLSKRSLAAALLLRDGHELLAKQSFREALCRKASIKPVGRWHPGKGTALEVAQKLGLPQAFAGSPGLRAPSDVEYISGRIGLPPLEDFQLKVKRDADELLQRARRCILTMPTGAGKTRTAVEFLRDFVLHGGEQGCVLWIAHTTELLEQAVESISQVWSNSTSVPDVRIERRFGSHCRGETDDTECLAASSLGLQVVIATPARLINDIERWKRDHTQAFATWHDSVRLIIIDEAHRAASPQYKSLMDEFGGDEAQAKVLGLTATPFRREYLKDTPELGTKELYSLFRRIAHICDESEADPRVMLQERGVLSKPTAQLVPTGSSLTMAETGSDLDIESIERIDQRLAQDADQTARRTLVFRHLEPICKDPKNRVIYFGPTVRDAEIASHSCCAPTALLPDLSRAKRGKANVDAPLRTSNRANFACCATAKS